MLRIDHQVRVFVYQILNQGIEYLLLRRKPRSEWPFGPVIGTVRPEEHMQDTVLRRVASATGIARPLHVTDLLLPRQEVFGDMGIVEWPFAFQAGTASRPVAELKPGPNVSDIAWMDFETAFAQVGDERDRQALVRLRVTLEG